MGLWDLYGTYLANFISSGSLIKRRSMDSFSIRPAYNKIMTRKAITQVWIIASIPVHFDSNLTLMIRRAMKERFPDVHTMVDIHASREIVNTGAQTFRRKLASAMGAYENYKETFESLPKSDRVLGKIFRRGANSVSINKEGLKRFKEKADSFLYVHKAKGEGSGFFSTNVFIRAQAQTNDEMMKYGEFLMEFLTGEGIELFPIYGDINNYLTNYGPATYGSGDLRKFPTMLMSDQNIASISPTTTRGLFGEGNGVMFGLDILSSQPAFVNLFNTSSAQVFLLCAISGYGKSAISQMITLSIVSDGKHVSVVDMKGDEWSKIFPYQDNYMSIDMDSGTWVNTLRLDDLKINETDGGEAYRMAVDATVSVFKTATSISEKEGSPYDVNDFLKKATEKVFTTLRGFKKDDPKTYNLTRNLTFPDVINALDGISKSEYNDSQKQTINLLIQRSREEFSDENLPPMREITLAEVLNTSYVVYSFNRAKGASVTHRDAMRLKMCSFLNKKKHYYRRLMGLHTIEIYEEIQIADSVGTGGELIKIIKDDVTIGRSDNVSVFLITNALSTLNNSDMKSIKSNITGLLIGKISDDDIKILETINGGRSIVKYVENISRGDNPKLRHCFALRFDNGRMSDNTMIKAIIPDDIEKVIRQRAQDS